MLARHPAIRSVGLLCLALLATMACAGEPREGRVQGVVVAVEARSVARADAFTLRGDDGRERVFRVDPRVDWTPGHLREHAALGEPVVVGWTRADGALVAVRVRDAE